MMGLDELGKAMETLRAKRLKSKLLVLIAMCSQFISSQSLSTPLNSCPALASLIPHTLRLAPTAMISSYRSSMPPINISLQHRPSCTPSRLILKISCNLVTDLCRQMDFFNSTFQSDVTIDPWRSKQ
eukprot:Gb_23114 [translate_table: standard]